MFNWEHHPEMLDFPDYLLEDEQLVELTDDMFSRTLTDGNHTAEWWDAWDRLENYLWEEYHLVLHDYWDDYEYGTWYDEN